MKITYIPTVEGLGAQYQRIIGNYLYSINHGLSFVYTPFTSANVTFHHNYANDVSYASKLDALINLKDTIPTTDQRLDTVDFAIICKYFEDNIDALCSTNEMKFIKNCFWKNKNKPSIFDNGKINVAVHIRRTNLYDTRKSDSPYLLHKKIMKHIRDEYKKEACQSDVQFHIYSQGDISYFKEYDNSDIVFHLNEDICDSFTEMVAADILITSASSLSYVAALLSDNIVYYVPFWHKPKKDWIICQ